MENKTTTTRAPRSASTTGPKRGPAGARGGRSGGPRREERARPEFDQKMISIRRVTRVVSGGRRMSFSVAMIIGDKKGSVGIGTGKGIDTALAIGKALKDAKKNMITIKTTKSGSIPHDVSAKYCSSRVMFMPNSGKGTVAGSALRDIVTLAGLKDITGKIHSGSKNKLNNARAAFVALSQVASPYKARVTEAKPVEAATDAQPK